MKKELMAYNAPTSEALELRFEGVFCQSGWDSDNNTENLIDDEGLIGL